MTDAMTVNKGSTTPSNRYIQAVNSAYSKFRVFDPDLALFNDPEAHEKLMQDPKISMADARRRRAIAGLETKNVPASEDEGDVRAALFMDDAFTHINKFNDSRAILGSAYMQGSKWGYIDGRPMEIRLGDDSEVRKWWIPTSIDDADTRDFRLMRIDGGKTGKIQTAWEKYSYGRKRWEQLTDLRPWIRVVFENIESHLGYGRGLRNCIYFYARAKWIAMEYGLSGLERWAKGLVIISIDGMRSGSTLEGNEVIRQAYEDEWEKTTSSHVFTKDSRDEIDVLQWDGQGWQINQWFIEYLDNCIEQAILTSLLPTGSGGDVGSNARAEVEVEVAEQMFQSDRMTLGEDIDRSLGKLVWDLNLPMLREVLGPDVRRPKFTIVQAERLDPMEELQKTRAMLEAGMPVDKREAYEKAGRTQPADDAEPNTILTPADLPSAQAGSPFGGNGFNLPPIQEAG